MHGNSLMRDSTMAPPLHPTGGYDEVRYQNGAAEYLLGGERHRLDGPAYVSAAGTESHYLYGLATSAYVGELVAPKSCAGCALTEMCTP